MPRRSPSRLVALLGLVTLSAAAGDAASSSGSLADAMKARGTARVASLLKERVDSNATQPDGTTALHWAAYWNDAATVERLLAAGAKAAVTNRYGESPLSIASANGDAHVIELL